MEIIRVTKSGYKWDKRFFWGVVLVVLGSIFGIFYVNDFNMGPYYYAKCEASIIADKCNNPFYTPANPKTNCDWCNDKFLAPGEYGERPPPYTSNLVLISFSGVLVALGLNHLVHNRGKTFDLGLEQYDKYKKYLDKIEDDEGEK